MWHRTEKNHTKVLYREPCSNNQPVLGLKPVISGLAVECSTTVLPLLVKIVQLLLVWDLRIFNSEPCSAAIHLFLDSNLQTQDPMLSALPVCNHCWLKFFIFWSLNLRTFLTVSPVQQQSTYSWIQTRNLRILSWVLYHCSTIAG
jgi:hypothetical protein